MRVGELISRLGKNIIEFLFPPSCPICSARIETHGELCADCFGAFEWIDDTKCERCGYPMPVGTCASRQCPACVVGESKLEWLRCACVYDDMSRSVLLPLKYAGRVGYAKFMSRAMIWAMRDVSADFDLVMPVPLARRRLTFRSYNQATLLARPIARAAGVTLDVDSVRRRHRRDMGHMTQRQRRENIRGVFSVVRPENIRGRKILLVDDVFTTGATMDEMRRVLMRAGAAAVYGVAFSRVVRTV